jgi:hypothetical protein
MKCRRLPLSKIWTKNYKNRTLRFLLVAAAEIAARKLSRPEPVIGQISVAPIDVSCVMYGNTRYFKKSCLDKQANIFL